MPAEAEQMPVANIVVGHRVRKEIRHLGYLSESIRVLGLFHPVIVNSRNELVAGFRRLEAVKLLGWEKVPVRKIDTLDDAMHALRAEQEENTCREPLTPTELVEIGRMIEELEKPKAKERKKAGTNQHTEPAGKLPASSKGDTRDKVAGALGVSGKTYEKAKKVVEAAEAEPEKFGDLPAQMEATGKVDPAYKELKARKGERVPPAQKKPAAKAPPSLNGKSKRAGAELAHQAVAVLSRIRKDDLLRDRALEIVRSWLASNTADGEGKNELPSFYTEISRLTDLLAEIPDTKKHGAYWESIKPWDVVGTLEDAAASMYRKARSLRRTFHI